MIKKISIILIMTGILFLPILAYAQTTNFRISVTVPAIIGYNTPPFDSGSTDRVQTETNGYNADMTTEEVFRGDEKIVLNTIVMEK